MLSDFIFCLFVLLSIFLSSSLLIFLLFRSYMDICDIDIRVYWTIGLPNLKMTQIGHLVFSIPWYYNDIISNKCIRYIDVYLSVLIRSQPEKSFWLTKKVFSFLLLSNRYTFYLSMIYIYILFRWRSFCWNTCPETKMSF